MDISGKCHCGAISFTATVDPQRVLVCHCTDCQIFSGAPFRAVLPVDVTLVKLVGSPKQYVKRAQSGNERAQAFCGNCGTQLYATEANEPKVLNIRLGCIDQRAQLLPRLQIWTRSAMPWVHALNDIPAKEMGSQSAAVNNQS
jgi:hypothetical protein